MSRGRSKKKALKAAKTPGAESPPQPPDRRTLKKARRFLKDVHKLLKKNESRVKEKEREKLDAAIQGVETALEGREDGKRLSTALKELDTRVDQILGFAKKSTAREYAESIVIAILIAIVLRAFVVEAFKIPTGSMIPTLAVGDHIFVNKFIYGLRIPLTNSWFVEWGSPDRGDIIVFRYPKDLSKDYIKRVVAVAGDRIRVEGRDVFVNDQKLEHGEGDGLVYVEEGEDTIMTQHPIERRAMAYCEQSRRTSQRYTVIYDDPGYARAPFPNGHEHGKKHCKKDKECLSPLVCVTGECRLDGLSCVLDAPNALGHCVVQDGFVFVMGDNRDNSSDGRVWGGVPIKYVKGKAMFVWWSKGRVSGVRWGRMGTAVHTSPYCEKSTAD